MLKGLTPTGVNTNFDKFLALPEPLRASSGFVVVVVVVRAYILYTLYINV